MTQRGEDEGGEVCVEQHTQRDSSHSKLARLALVVQPLQGEQPDGCVRSNTAAAPLASSLGRSSHRRAASASKPVAAHMPTTHGAGAELPRRRGIRYAEEVFSKSGVRISAFRTEGSKINGVIGI